MAVLFFVLAALACTAHCKPSGDPGVVLKKNSEAHAIAGDHESKLSPPWIKEMEGYEEDINQALETLWPFINFLFGFDTSDSEDSDDSCADEMIIQLVPDDSSVTSSTKKGSNDANPEPVPVPIPDTTTTTTTTTEAPAEVKTN
ncbi:uncharacterized protein LOC121740581 [Aricia agestis]|uniref:uncharacterized protein LOC121740581 n=1 Tax=Aricia agestis TaxID=91739 RepID=UPI001C2066E8|nr:uncharacterized protein LOC121740581 [Aricia agestis]